MRFKLALAITASFAAAPAFAAAEEARGVYVGVFGGGGSSSDADVTQRSTLFFTEAEGGPLAVNATGQTDSDGVWFVGAQIGHEWSYGGAVLPALELEAIYLDTGDRSATLDNDTDRLPEHTFDSTFPTDTSVFLANLVLSFPASFHGLTPYVGGGIGAARVAIEGATSLQTDPTEGNLNHFNSGPDSSAWTFAGQVKAGARIALGRNAYAFGEYRYVHIGSTDQEFGPTVDVAHTPTTAWTVNFDDTSHHLASVGIGFRF